MPGRKTKQLPQVVNIYIVDSSGVTIGDKNSVGQNFSSKTDVSTWEDTEKLALAYLTGYSDEIAFSTSIGTFELVNLGIVAEYLDENLRDLQKSIHDSRTMLTKAGLSNKHDIDTYKAVFTQMLRKISHAINALTLKQGNYKLAFEAMQSNMENRGAPQAIAYRFEDPSTGTKNLLSQAKTHFADGQTIQAIETLKRFLETNRDSVEGSALLMECFVFSRKYIEAIAWSNSCLEQVKDAAFRSYLIIAYKNNGEISKAKEETDKFKIDFPDHPNARIFD